MALKDYSSSIKDLQLGNLQDADAELTIVRKNVPEQDGEKQSEHSSNTSHSFNPEDLAKQILQHRSYVYSRTAYPVFDEYLRHLRAIAKIGDIPVSTVINNILALFFDERGLLTPTNVSIKAMLNQEGHATLKDYLGSMRSPTKKP